MPILHGKKKKLNGEYQFLKYNMQDIQWGYGWIPLLFCIYKVLNKMSLWNWKMVSLVVGKNTFPVEVVFSFFSGSMWNFSKACIAQKIAPQKW